MVKLTKTARRARESAQAVRGMTLSFALLLVLPLAARAESVHFDVPRTLPGRDVTSDEFLQVNPHERLVEVRFPISSLIRADENDLLQFFYRFDCGHPGVEVIDYLPKTTLTSAVVGNVGIQRNNEDSRNVGLAVTGAFDHVITGTGTGNVASKNSTSLKYDLLPPMEMVSASGTLNRRSGVYFKLKPTQRTSLEGGKEFVIVLRVPEPWRAGYLQVHCQAMGLRRTAAPPFEERALLGDESFLVAVYGEGDEGARRAAIEFAESEARLRNLSLALEGQIQRHAFPSLAHRVGGFLTLVNPRVPDNWLEVVVQAPPDRELDELTRHLPDSLRDAADEFAAAKRDLAAMTR